MPTAPIPAVALTPVAYFPKGYFLENLAVRSDGSVLVSSLLHKELWSVPGPDGIIRDATLLRIELRPATVGEAPAYATAGR